MSAGPAFSDDFSCLPLHRLARMQRAADAVIAVLGAVAARGGHVVGDLIGAGPFVVGEHYPPDDVYDHETGAGYYYHAHPDGDDRPAEHGHFHLAINRLAVPRGTVTLKRPGRPVKGWGQCHLVGIAIATNGLPVRLFTLNQWVSREWLYPAPVVIDLLDRFDLPAPTIEADANRFVVAMAALFRPQIECLLGERDRVLATRPPSGRATSIYQDRTLEIPSMIDIDLDRQIAAVDRALQGR